MKASLGWSPFHWLTRAAILACVGLAMSIGVMGTAMAACGNGVVEAGEDCDDGGGTCNGCNGSTNSCCTATCTFSSKVPDVIVGELVGRTGPYRLNGITAFGIGTTSCNVGSCWLNWYSSIAEHPVIGQNMYRLKAGRFEQIGQAWLKHGFTALQGTVCSGCTSAPNGQHLGVGCSDPYDATLNDDQNRMGPKSHVNAGNGVYMYPDSQISTTGDAIFKRLQVHNADLDPGQNAGASYFVEGQYVTRDDAAAKNSANNGSYRTITVSGVAGSGNYDISLTGSTQRQHWAIEAWKVADPNVTFTYFGDGLILGARATSLGGGVYHYEYAVMGTTTSRGMGSFSVPIPSGAAITNAGFHDVDYHSGEPYDGTDWPVTVGASSVSWATTPYATNQNANALRWGTLYNFRFDCNSPPITGTITAGYFGPGAPATTTAESTIVPDVCNHDGVCGLGENCTNCAVDCSNQGGGTGCCGNGVCQPGENPCRCAADCGTPSAVETSCTNSIDEDCDNLTDCADVDCCHNGACLATDADADGYNALCDCNNNDGSVYPHASQLCDHKNNDCSDPNWPALPASEADADSDGIAACANDCDDSNGAVWAIPSESNGLIMSYEAATGTIHLIWGPPVPPGGTVVHYDVLRSDNGMDFMGATAACVATDLAALTTDDAAGAGPGLSAYLVRARNACPNGLGVLGYDSNGIVIPGRTCP